jgi:hypothetical protein
MDGYERGMRTRQLLTLGLAIAACAGGAVASSAATPTYYRLPLNDKLVAKPQRIEFKDLDLTSIRWTGWGARTATGRARASSLQCDPSCAEGTRIRTTARLRMFKRKVRNRKRIYTCMTGTLARGKDRRIQWPPGCSR